MSEAAFEGRAMELTRLLAPVILPRPDTPAVVLVTGPRGAGRTRLLAEAARRGTEREPSLRVWRANLGAPDELARIEARLGIRSGGRSARMIEAGQSLLEAAAYGPVAIAIDDVHLGTPQQLDLVAAWARTLRGYQWRRGLPAVSLWLAWPDAASGSALRAELERGLGVARVALEPRGDGPAAESAVSVGELIPIEPDDPLLEQAAVTRTEALEQVRALEYRAGLLQLREALAIFEPLGQASDAMQILADKGWIRLRLGDLDGAERDLGTALAQARAAEASRVQQFCLDGLARVAAERDDPSKAQAAIAEADRIERALLSRLERAATLVGLGWFEPVRPELEMLLALARAESSALIPRVLLNVGRAALGDGDPEAALAAAAEANVLSEGPARAEAEALQALVYIALGRAEEALREADLAVERVVGDDGLARLSAVEARAQALLAVERADDAAQTAAPALALARGAGLIRRADRLAALVARSLQAGGRSDLMRGFELLGGGSAASAS